ncbi:MAG: DeoR/GlpR transcriptional regulator [Lachnospiraceae bacterium]|nr:DeoR/GlpR transcriptional regulator [Lachnospiraceae bacterium]
MQEIRRDKIKELLRTSGFVNVQDLASRFQVSSETIRRDLEQLEKEGAVKRVHGGAMSTLRMVSETAFVLRQQSHTPEKRLIARAAAEMIADGDTVILSPGTSTLQIAPFLAPRKNLTVITNGLPLAMQLAEYPEINVYFLGGHLRGEDLATSGSLAFSNLALFNPAKLILGIGGITPENGLTDFRMEESALLRAFIDKAACTIAIGDHSKFGKVCAYSICPAGRLDVLITDSGTPAELCRAYQELGVSVRVVNVPAEEN